MNCKRDRSRKSIRHEGQRDPRLLARRRSSPVPAQEGLSHAEDPALSPPLKRIDQDKLLLGDYTLREVIENGRHLFTTPFTKAEGYGEGGKPDGSGGFLIGPRETDLPPEPRCLPDPDPVWAIERPAPPIPELPRAGGQSEHP